MQHLATTFFDLPVTPTDAALNNFIFAWYVAIRSVKVEDLSCFCAIHNKAFLGLAHVAMGRLKAVSKDATVAFLLYQAQYISVCFHFYDQYVLPELYAVEQKRVDLLKRSHPSVKSYLDDVGYA